MTKRYNTALTNTIVSVFESTFEGGTLEIYDGAQPTTGDDAATGTLLATITLPADAFTTASGGAIAKQGTWEDTVDTSGTAGWARLSNAGGTDSMDLAITGTGGGGEIELDNTSLVAGGIVSVSTFGITQPAA